MQALRRLVNRTKKVISFFWNMQVVITITMPDVEEGLCSAYTVILDQTYTWSLWTAASGCNSRDRSEDNRASLRLKVYIIHPFLLSIILLTFHPYQLLQPTSLLLLHPSFRLLFKAYSLSTLFSTSIIIVTLISSPIPIIKKLIHHEVLYWIGCKHCNYWFPNRFRSSTRCQSCSCC